MEIFLPWDGFLMEVVQILTQQNLTIYVASPLLKKGVVCVLSIYINGSLPSFPAAQQSALVGHHRTRISEWASRPF